MPKEIANKNLIFVDCEGHGPAPTLNDPVGFEFGAVAYPSRQTFHGTGATKETFEDFDKWISSVIEKGFRPLFVSDNPAYDWQFINYYFHLFLGKTRSATRHEGSAIFTPDSSATSLMGVHGKSYGLRYMTTIL